MDDALRLLLLLALAGALVTVTAVSLRWWLEEQRRLTRVIRKCLGVDPDAQIIAHGQNSAAAVSVDAEQVLVLRRGGRDALLYPLDALLGAELIVDDEVTARVFRGEPRKALDAIRRDAQVVRLRLVFDNIRDPDFELELAGSTDEDPADAIKEARTWLARAEAIMRRPVSQPAVRTREAVPPVGVEEEAEPEEDDEAPF